MNKDKMLDELSVLQERFANGMGWRDGEYEEALDEAIELIKEMPSADVVEVKHGEWINPEMGYEDCSVCGYCFAVYDEHDCYIERNFCPNCGADMRKRRETE